MSETPEKIRPFNTTARTLRPILRKAGVEHLVSKFGTGKNTTYIRIKWVNAYDLQEAVSASKVAEVLRPLWADGKTRVRIVYGALVAIDRKGWWKTLPDTPEARAQLKAEEDERNTILLAALEEGKRIRACNCMSSVEFQPTNDDPRRPWLKKPLFGFPPERFSPFEVYLCRN